MLPLLMPSTPAGASGDYISGLIAQRVALQQQVNGLLGDRAAQLDQLLQLQDRIAGLRDRLRRNAATLAGLESQQAALETRIRATDAEVQRNRAGLGGLARGQYKGRAQSSVAQILFGSTNLDQVLNQIAAGQAVSNRAHTLVVELRADEARLAADARDVAQKHADANLLEARLVGQRADLQASAASYQARLSAIDADSHGLLSRINALDSAIAAASSGPGAGGSYARAQIVAIIRTAAARFGANADQMVRVATCESSLNPRAYNRSSGASGLFQFMPGTFYGHGGKNIWDPVEQSNIAADMFSHGGAGSWACT